MFGGPASQTLVLCNTIFSTYSSGQYYCLVAGLVFSELAVQVVHHVFTICFTSALPYSLPVVFLSHATQLVAVPSSRIVN